LTRWPMIFWIVVYAAWMVFLISMYVVRMRYVG
jgi:hypothetical protein